ncbi:MAG: tRNA (adenine-N1)-methyltransferase [Thermodesulfobacteriales bacterium]|jgi:tRNA (adenine57-N1/adenine58-N1)-methyltransferase
MKIKTGDHVLIISPDEKTFLVVVSENKKMGTHKGEINLGDCIGKSFGERIHSNLEHAFLLLEPTLEDKMMKVKRHTQIIYPKDAAYMILKTGIQSGMRVIECGAGSGSLTMALANAVAPSGMVYAYDVREKHLDNAKMNIENAGYSDYVEFKLRQAQDGFDEEDVDVVILDLPSPWDGIASAAKSLRGGGRIASLSPTYNQIEKCVENLEKHGFVYIETLELLLRYIQVSTGKTRPVDRMVSHTGFLTFGRKIISEEPNHQQLSEFAAPNNS